MLDYNTDDGPLFTPGSREMSITVSNDATLVTVVSMIAPSPDWFVSARNINLYENGEWVEEKIVVAPLYDAGTDSGEEFNSEDEDTDPKEVISRVEDAPEAPIAIFTFSRTLETEPADTPVEPDEPPVDTPPEPNLSLIHISEPTRPY